MILLAISSGLLSGLVIAVVMAGVPLAFGSFERTALKQAQHTAMETFGDIELRHYRWLGWFYGAWFLVFNSAVAYAVWQRPNAWEMFAFFGFLFALLGAWGVCDVLRSRVTVRGSQVVCRRLFNEKSFELGEVQSVRTFRGNIIVDLGRVPRIVIPTIFQGSGKLIALLQHSSRSSRHRHGTVS